MAAATANIDKGLKAGDWIKHVAPVVGGGGGGRPDQRLRAGGKGPARLYDAARGGRGVRGSSSEISISHR
ncbi:MAG: DHHA1 domain-containing protein [Phycisphaerales bacterium]